MNQNAAEIKSMESVKSILAEHKEQIAKFLENNPYEGLWAAVCLFFASQNKLKLVPSDKDYQGFNVIARDEDAQIDVMITDPIADNSICNKLWCVASDYPINNKEYKEIALVLLSSLCINKDSVDFVQNIRTGKSFVEYVKYLDNVKFSSFENYALRMGVSQRMFKDTISYMKSGKNASKYYDTPKEIFAFATNVMNIQVNGNESRRTAFGVENAGLCNASVVVNDTTPDAWKILHTVHESDEELYALGVLNMYFHAITFIADKLQGSTCSSSDYFWSVPKMGTKFYDIQENKAGIETDICLEKSSQECENKSIGVYPQDICYRTNKDLLSTRKRIVDEDILESVILLPSDLFSDTSAQTVVIVVNKQKQNKGFVRFVDVSGCCEAKYNHNVLNVEDALSLYNSVDNNANVKDVPNQCIADQGYILYPNLYINGNSEIPEDMEEVTLGELLAVADTEDTYADSCDYVYSESYVQNRLGRIISASSLPEVEETLSVSEARSNWQQCTQDSIVFSGSSFRYLKDNYDSYPRTLIPYSYNAFKVVSDKVKPEYLVYQLSSPFFKSQLEKFEKEREMSKPTRKEILAAKIKGVNILKESKFGILNCKIRIHKSLDQQMVIAEAEAAKEKKMLDRKRKAREASSHENYVLNMRQRKHAVAQVLNEILPAVENIQSFIFNRGTIDKDSVVSRRNGTTLGQYVSSVKNQLDKVSMMVDSFTNIDAYGVPERVELGQFLKEYCDSKINEVYRPVFVNKDNREWIVDICPKDLTQALDNLFTNAVKHGFKDLSRKNYQIRVEISNFKLESGKVAIFVANNGEPASKSVSLDRMFVWGVGQGTGIGCSQVKEIVEYFDGEVSYTEYPGSEDGFECVFKIVLPLIID